MVDSSYGPKALVWTAFGRMTPSQSQIVEFLCYTEIHRPEGLLAGVGGGGGVTREGSVL